MEFEVLPGCIVFGVNPKDPLQKPGRPAIVLAVENTEDRKFLVIFGQSHNTGRGPYLHIKDEDHRTKVHGYFFAESIQKLPATNFGASEMNRLPKDIWNGLRRLLTDHRK